MRLLCYFHPSIDPFALRDRLRAIGWQQVAMRDGSLWRTDSRPESGWASVHAPAYPGIARAYADMGAKIIEIDDSASMSLPLPPVEIESLPSTDVYAILNPGKHLMAELDAVPVVAGAEVIAVNEAARRAPCNWQLCNDGFSDAKFQGTIGEHGRITRRRFATTIPTGRWFSLDRIGIVDGTFSTTCALRCAASAKPSTVYLYGHDLLPGNGLDGMTGHWDNSQLSNAKAEVDAQVSAMRESGIQVIHVRFVDGKIEQDDGSSRVVNLPKRRKGK